MLKGKFFICTDYARKKYKNKSGHAITMDDKSKVKAFDGALIPKELMDKKEAPARKAKETRKTMDEKLKAKYGELTVEEIKDLLFEKKWMTKIDADIEAEAARVLSGLSAKVFLIAKRYEHTLGEIERRTARSWRHWRGWDIHGDLSRLLLL